MARVTFSPEIGDLPVHGVGEHNSQGHALLSLVGGVAEHKTLRMVGCEWQNDKMHEYSSHDISQFLQYVMLLSIFP